jgi:uncharacterized membrane protein YjjP (DUF1212 family)
MKKLNTADTIKSFVAGFLLAILFYAAAIRLSNPNITIALVFFFLVFLAGLEAKEIENIKNELELLRKNDFNNKNL